MATAVLKRTSASWILNPEIPLPKMSRSYASGNLRKDFPECFEKEGRRDALLLKVCQFIREKGPMKTWWDVLNYSQKGLKLVQPEKVLLKETPKLQKAYKCFSDLQRKAFEKVGIIDNRPQLVEESSENIDKFVKIRDWAKAESAAQKALDLFDGWDDWVENNEQATDQKRFFLSSFAMAVSKQKNPKADSLTKAMIRIQDAYLLASLEKQRKAIDFIAGKLLLKRDIPKHAARTCDHCKANFFFKRSETPLETEVTDHDPCPIKPSRTISLVKSTPPESNYSPPDVA